MGRLLEVLGGQGKPDETGAEGAPAPPAPRAEVVPEPEPEEIPYIEIGPRRQFEASPSVLAASPVRPPALPPAPEPQPAEAPAVTPAAPVVVSPVAVPRDVVFRTLPSRPRSGEKRTRFTPELITYHAPQQPAAARYRDLLAALLSTPAGSAAHPALLFTAAGPEVGTTTILLNVGITAAQEGRRVIAVDANLRRPGVAPRLGLPETPGLRDVLLGAVTLERFFQETDQPNLFALTAGTPAGHASPSFAPDTVRSLLAQLRQRFDLVLVDGPPWDGKPDATILGTACDAVYLVVSAAQAHTPAVEQLLQTIPEQGACLAGYVLASA